MNKSVLIMLLAVTMHCSMHAAHFARFALIHSKPTFDITQSAQCIKSMQLNADPVVAKKAVDFIINRAGDCPQNEPKYAHSLRTIAQETQLFSLPYQTFLFSTVKNNLPQLTEILLEQNMQPDQVINGRTPLHDVKSIAIAQMLLKKGANRAINLQDLQGNTPLHYAPHDLVDILITHGANLTIRNHTRCPQIWSPKPLTAKEIRYLVGSFVIASVALLEASDRSFGILCLPFLGAASCATINCLALFVTERGQILVDGFTPLMKAVDESDGKKFKALMRHGIDDIESLHSISWVKGFSRYWASDSSREIHEFINQEWKKRKSLS